MFTDPIADYLIRIKNGYLAGKRIIIVPHSKYKERLAKLLSKEGYLGQIEIDKKSIKKPNILTHLIYEKNKAKVTNIQIISKASRRVYIKKDQIPILLRGIGIAVLSTPEGIMTAKQAYKKGIGGEVVCKIW